MAQMCICGCDSSDTAGYEVIKDAVDLQGVINDPVNQRDLPNMQVPEPEKVATAGPIKLTLELLGARGLRNADWMPGYGKSDCYCVVKCRGKTVHTTKVIRDCLEPKWGETVEGIEWEEGQNLEFDIFDKDVLTSNFLGKVLLESQNFATEGFNDEVQVAEAGKGISAFLRLKIKVPGKDFPAADFEIEVSKGDAAAWGLGFDTQDPKILSVFGITAGPFQLYNRGAPPGRQLKENDFIKSVNGIAGNTQAMLAQFKMQKHLRIVVVRGMQFNACLDLTNPSTSIGLTLRAEPTGSHLVIFKVLNSGAIPDYNKRMTDEALKICDADRIMAVRGVKGCSGYLQTELTKNRGKMQITILRPNMEK